MVDKLVRIFDHNAPPASAPPYLPNGGAVVYPPRATFGPRVQGDYQLVLVHAGSARVTVDGVGHDIPPGHVSLLRPGGTEHFAFARERDTYHSWIALPPAYLEDDARGALDAAPRLLPLSAAMASCVALGREIAAVDEPARRPVLAAIARTALALYIAEAAHVSDGAARGHPAVIRARAIARERACDGLSVGELAREVGLSAEHLVRLFRRHLGVTPGAFMRAERLSHGMSLLTHTGLTVAEVAHRAGFASPHHFAHALRAATGASPTELRARGWTARPQVLRRPPIAH